MAYPVFFSENKLPRMGTISNLKECSGTVQLFKLKVFLTFDDLVFADLTPFAVTLGIRGIEN